MIELNQDKYLCKKSQNNPNLLLIMILAIVIIYNSGSVLMTVNHKVGFVLLFFTFTIFLIRHLRIRENIKLNLFNISFILFILMCGCSYLININFVYLDANFRFIVTLGFSFLFVKYVDFDIFIKYYIKITKVIVILSLIPYFLINYLDLNIVQNLPIIININGVRYYNGLLFYYYTYSQSRNMGVFWEPSIFSSLIAMAMVYEICFTKEKPSLINLTIFLLGLITTQSTGGYFLLSLVILLFFFKNANTLKSIVLQMGLLVTTLLLYFNINKVLLFLVSINPRVFSKLLLFYENISVAQRIQSPIANVELFLENPFFGLGLGNVDFAYSKFNICQTSTSTYYLAVFGFLGILYTLLMIIGVMKQQKHTIITRIIIILILLSMVNKEPHFWFVITYIIIFYFIKPKNMIRVS